MVSPYLMHRRKAFRVPAEDADATAYLNAVEEADQQTLEPAVRTAINDFVVGCKADGIWAPIKASCILAGARTLDGALVPLVGTAPTNFNFVSADYNRKTGLIGDGSTKYLNSNRAHNADNKDNKHLAIYASSLPTISFRAMIGTGELSTGTTAFIFNTSTRLNDNSSSSYTAVVGFIGISRPSSSSYNRRNNLVTTSLNVTTSTSVSATSNSVVFANNTLGSPNFGNARLAFYSIGESLDLALLDSRVSALMTALNSAIP